MKYDKEDIELLTLLDLNGQSYWIKRYWVKIEAQKVTKDQHRPHGIKYSLTLHDRNNTRILGYDNAHAVKKRGRKPKKYSGRIVTYDHIHRELKVERYLFESASQMLSDFWDDVNRIVDD